MIADRRKRQNRQKSENAECALCHDVAPLQLSHIIPEFMYGPLYDQLHRFYSISSLSSKPNRLLQKGLRERLLCRTCEQRFSRLENYASKVFFGDGATQPVRLPTGFLFAGLEYKPLKLFFMSLIWRLSVTSVEYFAGADLGPHREGLRTLLLADDPRDYLTYPAMVVALTHKRRHLPDLIIRPFQTRLEGRRVYGTVITGFLFHFFVSNQKPPVGLWPGFLQESGNFPLHVTEITEVPWLQRWGAEIARAEAIRNAANAAKG